MLLKFLCNLSSINKSLEQLDKNDPPVAPATYPLSLAVQCLTAVIESQSLFVLPLLGGDNDSDQTGEDSIILSIEMAKSAAPSILASLTLLSTSHIEDDLLRVILWSFNKFTVILAQLGLVPYRDAFLASLCRLSVPGYQLPREEIASIANEITQMQLIGIFLNKIQTSAILHDRNMLFVKVLTSILNEISSVMDSKTWFNCLEALQIVDGMVVTGKTGKRMESSPGLLEFTHLSLVSSPGTHRTRSMTGSFALAPPLPSSVSPAVPYIIYSKSLFEQSAAMKVRPFTEFVRAICRLAHESIMHQGDKEKSEQKLYAISKLLLVTTVNVKRLLNTEFSIAWDLIIGQLIQMAHAPTIASSVRNQVMQAFDEILIESASIGDLADESVERKILQPIETIMGLDTIGEDYFKLNWLQDVQKAGLETLNKLLQTNGQNFKTAWVITLDIIQAIVRSSLHAKKKPDFSPIDTVSQISPIFNSPIVDSPGNNYDGSSQKTVMVTRVAFPCIQLITTDFLPLLNPTVLTRCIDTLSLYGSLADDLNISLTSVGLLWSVCDFILTKRHKLEEQDSLAENDQPFRSKPSSSLVQLDTETGI